MGEDTTHRCSIIITSLRRSRAGSEPRCSSLSHTALRRTRFRPLLKRLETSLSGSTLLNPPAMASMVASTSKAGLARSCIGHAQRQYASAALLHVHATASPAVASTSSAHIKVPSVPSTSSVRHTSACARSFTTSSPAAASPAAKPTSTTSNSSKATKKSRSRSTKSKKHTASTRELPVRKQYLLDQYRHVLTNSEVVVFFRTGQFTVAELTKLRVELSAIPPPSISHANANANAPAAPGPPSAETINEAASGARLLFLRAGLMRPTSKQLPHLPLQPVLEHLAQHGGEVAALVLPTLHPPTLKAALAAVESLSVSPNLRKIQKEAAAAAKAGGGAAAGGKGKPAPAPAAVKPKAKTGPAEERMLVIAALIESKTAVAREELTRIAALPAMDQILAQLVGLLETPARGIISMASRAGGEDLVRTLEGFKIGLEEAQKPAASAGEAEA